MDGGEKLHQMVHGLLEMKAGVEMNTPIIVMWVVKMLNVNTLITSHQDLEEKL